MSVALHSGVPNVYRHIRRETEDPSLRLVRTDIAGFLGYAERGPLSDRKTPKSGVQRLTSWAEFVATYGGFIRAGTLAYAVRAFFENKGEVCYVARIAALDAKLSMDRPAKARWESPSGLTLVAKSEGTWGNAIKVRFSTLEQVGGDTSATTFALRIVRERSAGQAGPPEEEFYPRLSLDEASPDYAPPRLRTSSRLLELIPPVSSREVLPLTPVTLTGGQDGLNAVTAADFIGAEDDLRGLRLFEGITEIAILCAPDAVLALPPREEAPKPATLPCQREQPASHPPAELDPPVFDDRDLIRIQTAMLDQCERLRDRVSVIDFRNSARQVQELQEWRQLYRSPFGAIYFPWLQVDDPLKLTGPVREVPPCGHVAGTYARIDRSVGVHRPPANVALEFVTDLAVDVDDEVQQELNPQSINAIRSFPGRGLRVWGARSLAGPDQAEWRFIHTRRFMSMLEESIEKSMKWAVFETNDATLRQTLRQMIEVFLDRVWRRGGLQGERREEAYYVKCDETNNPPRVTDLGQLLCRIGVALVAPMEFIIFELRPTPGGNALAAREV